MKSKHTLKIGLWGTGNGTTSYSENIGAIGVTKVICPILIGSFELPCKSSLEYKPQSKVIYEFKIFWNMLWQSMQFKRNVTRFHQSVESELKYVVMFS